MWFHGSRALRLFYGSTQNKIIALLSSKASTTLTAFVVFALYWVVPNYQGLCSSNGISSGLILFVMSFG
ncbi:hypothetical protein WN943_004130 [Citrus x changshan-huyou]